MTVAVSNNFGHLLAEKSKQEKRAVTISEVSKETGISRRTLYAWFGNTVTRFDGDVIDKLCEYFNVPMTDLIEHTPNE